MDVESDGSNELAERHRREKKELQGRVAKLKHAVPKGDKKKKKEVAEEIARMEAELFDRHQREKDQLKGEEQKEQNEPRSVEERIKEMVIEEPDCDLIANGMKYNKVKISKGQKRRDKKAVKEKERLERIAKEELEDTDNPRKIEAEQLKAILQDRQLSLHEVPSDGDCMYKAIEHQLDQRGVKTTIEDLRSKTASFMSGHRDDFLPFLTSDRTGDLMTSDEFDDYCRDVAETKCWGGHLELKALAHVLRTPIEVIQAQGPPIVIGDVEFKEEPLLLSYHRHAYRLGEHYNSLVKVKS